MAKDYSDAIALCKRKNVRIGEQTAELLTPTKGSVPCFWIKTGWFRIYSECSREKGAALRGSGPLHPTGSLYPGREEVHASRGQDQGVLVISSGLNCPFRR